MKIRTYTPADLEGVTDLWRECFAYPAPHNNPEDSIRRKTACDDGLFFIAVEKASVVGTIMAGWDGHRGWIYSLAVAHDRRKCGIGRSLILYAADELKKRDCPKINLQVMPGNDDVIGFYEKLGFIVEERISMGLKLY